MADLAETLTDHLRAWESGWNIGSFGAIAEFHQDDGEEALVDLPFERATSRGALRISRMEDVVPVAWEALSKNPRRWQQGIALCLPEAEAEGKASTVLTELGPDEEAIRAEDREGVLFDMGLGQRNLDFCIRTANPDLLAVLRREAGRALTEPGNPAMGAILKAHPHRVALSAAGRCEVFQMIGGPDTGGKSPEGPHTHVMPKLMAAGRTHSANVPIPAGLMPVMSLHPGNPVMTPLGLDREFSTDLFAAFQGMLEAWGRDAYTATKQRVWAAIDAGEAPEEDGAAQSRLERAARRNAIRQRARQSGNSPLLAAWSSAHDQGALEAEPDMPG
ncbi:MAG: hypothetical protein AAF908_07280, partial [Pseudomonadota bacterium]